MQVIKLLNISIFGIAWGTWLIPFPLENIQQQQSGVTIFSHALRKAVKYLYVKLDNSDGISYSQITSMGLELS